MIPVKRALFLFVCPTLLLLAACEPLAPDSTPRYVIVTGETAPAPLPSISPLVASTPVVAGAVGMVSTPIPAVTATRAATPGPSPTAFGCGERTGQVLRSSFVSDVLGDEVQFRLYLPPCFYETLARYPYVVLLHGTGYDEAMWEDLGAASVMDQGIAKGTLPPMVLIMPDGEALAEQNDQPDGQSYETLILDELIPLVESSFCLWGSPQGRAIGGISRGGFWAFSMALRHPEFFSAVGGHSPYFEPDNALPDTNPLSLVETANLAKVPLRIYLDNSASDYGSTGAQTFSDVLTKRGIEHQHVVNQNGEHDMEYWSEHVGEYLAFYGAAWPTDVSLLPSCLEPSP
jgi:enterochelin esterase-like enzyme